MAHIYYLPNQQGIHGGLGFWVFVGVYLMLVALCFILLRSHLQLWKELARVHEQLKENSESNAPNVVQTS